MGTHNTTAGNSHHGHRGNRPEDEQPREPEPGSKEFVRFKRVMQASVAVKTSAMCELDPKSKPKLHREKKSKKKATTNVRS
jgi:hypothetical protein